MNSWITQTKLHTGINTMQIIQIFINVMKKVSGKNMLEAF